MTNTGAKPVALFSHPDCLLHETGPGHPECADRLRAVMAALDHPEFAALDRRTPPEATDDQLRLAHPQSYLDALRVHRPGAGQRIPLDPDTWLSPGTLRAARLAVGAACAAVDAVMGGEASAAFAATRPPGHHAEPEIAMGFCLFGNAAIAARHALVGWGLSRVAIADFDVHHGNGTQAIVQEDDRVFFASSHQHPCYPGTGLASETGVGNLLNVPLPPGSGSAAFRNAWDTQILPAIDRFAPQLLIVSAGFDAHFADPLAAIELDEADFAWITARLKALAGQHCDGRLVSLLEGGYDLQALAGSVAAHLRILMQA